MAGKIRYAVVGLGHIAQVAVLPGFANSKSSELTALVSGSDEKLKKLGKKYQVSSTWTYKEFDDCLRSGEIDAVFIALPNDMHLDFTRRAVAAGIHVLCEKPLAVTVRECQQMIQAARRNKVKLMTAYRLHFEETNLEAIEVVRSGKIGEPRYFNSSFSFQITDPKNIRLSRSRGGGTLYDIGVYCINAARYIFGAEPEEVFAFSANNGEKRFKEVDEMTSALLRFPGERLASFVTSFGAADTDFFEVVGTEGSLRVEPAFEYQGELKFQLKVGNKCKTKTFKARDHFGAEIEYFSDCVSKDREPEPSGEEGLIDVQIVEALYKSARTRKPIKLSIPRKKARPTLKQEIRLPAVKQPKLVGVKSPHDD